MNLFRFFLIIFGCLENDDGRFQFVFDVFGVFCIMNCLVLRCFGRPNFENTEIKCHKMSCFTVFVDSCWILQIHELS